MDKRDRASPLTGSIPLDLQANWMTPYLRSFSEKPLNLSLLPADGK